MSYSDLFYGDTSFLNSHAPVGLWEDGPVDQFESGDAWMGLDPYENFGALDVGNKKSSKRNQAFEVLKKISAAIGHSRSFSASNFRNRTRPSAGSARREVANALKAFAKDNGIKLSNPLDPLASYSTANKNLGMVQPFAVAPVTPPPAVVTEEPTVDFSQFSLETNTTPSGQFDFTTPGLFATPSTVPGSSPVNPMTTYSPVTAPQSEPPTTTSPASVWKSPWVWAGLVAGFGVLGLGTYLLFGRD